MTRTNKRPTRDDACALAPGKRLYDLVRAGLLAHSTTLKRWAEMQGVTDTWVRRVLSQKVDGPAAAALRARAIHDAQVPALLELLGAQPAPQQTPLLNPTLVYPGEQLYAAIREGFNRQGTSFTRWCVNERIPTSNVRAILLRSSHRSKAVALRRRLVQESNALTVLQEQDPTITGIWEGSSS